jgi:hypothetical protein
LTVADSAYWRFSSSVRLWNKSLRFENLSFFQAEFISTMR